MWQEALANSSHGWVSCGKRYIHGISISEARERIGKMRTPILTYACSCEVDDVIEDKWSDNYHESKNAQLHTDIDRAI